MGGTMAYIVFILFVLGGAIFTGYINEQAFLMMNALLYVSFIVILIVKRTVYVTWLHLPIGIFVTCYWVACLYAVDLEAAILEASRVSSLIPLSLMTTMLTREKLTKLLFLWPWVGSFLVLYGVAFQLERNGRLESTLQYANALAIILLVSILISMLRFAKTQSKFQLLLLTVNAAGLLLTFSRAVWVLWFISIIVFMILIPQLRTKRSIISLLTAHFAILAVALLIKQDILYFINRLISIQTKTSEYQVRLLYWKDSIEMLLDYVWGGTGGGGWTVLHHIYQSQSYYVKFIHNHYVQVFLDIGLIGGLSWLALIIVFLMNGVSHLKTDNHMESIEIKGVIIIAIVMLLHAGFDFDLTFPLIFMLLISLIFFIPLKTKEIRVNLSHLVLGGTAVVGLSVLFVWMSVGYHWKEQGVRAVRANDLEHAQMQLDRAEKAIPWSSSILYESAKIFVRMGNESGDSHDYERAEEKLQRALLKTPQNKLYFDLNNEINSRN